MTVEIPVLDKINALYGLVISILTFFFGEHWILFALFLLLNVVDYITGCLKATINNKVNSEAGAKGIFKKCGYWILIMVAFAMSAVFIEVGETIGVNLQVSTLIGWFVLASLIINELRSIIENFIEAGYNVPKILTKGLEIAEKKLNEVEDIDNKE